MINNQSLVKLIQFDHQESKFVEPGLLPMFRLFVGIQIFLLTIVLIPNDIAPPDLDLRSFILQSLMWMVILMGHLIWPNLPHHLRKYFLPIALVAASVLPVLNQTIGFYFFLDLDTTPVGAAIVSDSSWRLLVILLVSLIFIACQYDFRQVVRVSIGIPLINLGLTAWLVRGSEVPLTNFVVLNINGGLIFLLVGYIITNLRQAQREKQQALVEENAKLCVFSFPEKMK